MYKKFSKYCCTALALILLAGCAEQVPTLDYTEQTPVDVEVEPSPSEEPSAGIQTALRIPLASEPETLNPIYARDAEMINFLSLIYESPMTLDENGKPVPELFESWEVEGAEWTFTVRKEVCWHDGQMLTAFDIEDTLNKILEPYQPDANSDETRYSIYHESTKLIDQGNFRAVNDTTFKLTAVSPGLDVLYALCFPVMPKKNSAPLVGTGPYMLQTKSKGGEYTLTVNPNWWKQLPSIQTVIAKPMKDSHARVSAFEKRELDMVYEPASIAPRYAAFTGTAVREVVTRYYYYLLPNLNNNYLRNPNFRRAVVSAINRKDVIFASLYGHGITAANAIPPDSWLFDMNADHMEYNESQAISYLIAGGYGYMDSNRQQHNPGNMVNDLRLIIPDGGGSVKSDMAESIRTQLNKIGIMIEVSSLSEEAYQAAIETGDYDFTICGVYLDTVPNPKKLYETEGDLNIGRYSSPAMDTTLSAVRTNDEKGYQQAYFDIQRIIGSDMPAIGLCFQTASVIYHDNIKGVGYMNDLRIFKGIQKWEIR